MNLQKTYPSLLAANPAAAEGWYAKLFGRGPDQRPMPTLLHWELSDGGGLMRRCSKLSRRRHHEPACRQIGLLVEPTMATLTVTGEMLGETPDAKI